MDWLKFYGQERCLFLTSSIDTVHCELNIIPVSADNAGSRTNISSAVLWSNVADTVMLQDII